MNNTPDQTRLLEQIRDTIKNLVDGSISYREAFDSYKILKGNAAEVQQSITPNPDGSTLLGLLHNHNITNFCKFTGEIILGEKEITIVSSSGNESLVNIAFEELKNHKHQIENSITCSFDLDLPDDLTYHVFASRSQGNGSDRIILSISSSRYSDLEKFNTFSDILNALHAFFSEQEGNLTNTSFFLNTRLKITDILYQYNEAGVPVKCMLYQFDNIYQIFEHRGLKTLVDIDEKIINSLQSYHGYDASVSIIGPSLYLVLLPVAEVIENKKNPAPARLLFEYEEVIFRYWVYRKILNQKTEIDTLFYWMSETLKENQ